MDKQELKSRMYNDDEEFESYVRELIQSERLIDSEPALGTAKQIVSKGINSISSRQEYAFIQHGLLAENYVEECAQCSNPIPWSEMLEALDDGYCSWCRNSLEKLERE